MTEPPVSILVPTYGRTRCLSEVLECFRRQTYTGAMELLILNDVQGQSLTCATPNVRIVNLPARCPSLGDKRNLAVAFAKHDLFLFVDDDDIFLPWYVKTAMRSYQAWQRPTWPHAHYYASGRGAEIRVRLVRQTHPASYLMSKTQFDAIGRYPFVYAGGDQLLRSKAFAMFKCQLGNHPLAIEAGYVYRWNCGTYHISGSKDHATAWTRTAADLQKRMASGAEPSGVVDLVPSWEADYVALASAALAAI